MIQIGINIYITFTELKLDDIFNPSKLAKQEVEKRIIQCAKNNPWIPRMKLPTNT